MLPNTFNLSIILLLLGLFLHSTKAAIFHQCQPLSSFSLISLNIQRNSSVLIYPLSSLPSTNIQSAPDDESLKRRLQEFTVCGVDDMKWCAPSWEFGQFTVRGEEISGPFINEFVKDLRTPSNKDASTLMEFQNKQNQGVYCVLIYQDGVYFKELHIKWEIGSRRSLLSLQELKRLTALQIVSLLEFGLFCWLIFKNQAASGAGSNRFFLGVLKFSLINRFIELFVFFINAHYLDPQSASLFTILMLNLIANLSKLPLFLHFINSLLPANTNPGKLRRLKYLIITLNIVLQALIMSIINGSNLLKEPLIYLANLIPLLILLLTTRQNPYNRFLLVPIFLALPQVIIQTSFWLLSPTKIIALLQLQAKDDLIWVLFVQGLPAFSVFSICLLLVILEKNQAQSVQHIARATNQFINKRKLDHESDLGFESDLSIVSESEMTENSSWVRVGSCSGGKDLNS